MPEDRGDRAKRAVQSDGGARVGESRWPPVAAVFAFLALNVGLRLWLPDQGAIRMPWALPVIEVALIVVLLANDFRGPPKRTILLRRVELTLVVLLLLAALWATVFLVHDLVMGSGLTNSPSRLLASGALAWLGNNIAFALLYWLLDGGGPGARAALSVPLDFAFTQHLSPELAPAGWRPVFLDYLHLGFTNATAFSPTDVMPLTHRAKYLMVVQASVALALFGLIVARAVNAFT
jgi:hypothetical protein